MLISFAPCSFIAFLLLGHIINNVVNSPKINWFMSLVDDNKRGSFTANKEIVSLIGGMVFSFVIGIFIDRFDEAGNLQASFVFCGIAVLVLTLLHTYTLIASKEKPVKNTGNTSVKATLGKLIKDKSLFKVILLSTFWTVVHSVATPFYGTYQVKELGFTMTFVSLLSALYAICRSLFSKPLGRYADKRSFPRMLNICYIVAACAFLVQTFTVPQNGKVFYTVYYMLYAVSMAGINSGEINLIYDFVDKENRVSALALKSTLAGFLGFFTTLAISPLVKNIQANGNTFLGLSVYAQQVVSAIAFVGVIGVLIYLNTVVNKMQTKRG